MTRAQETAKLIAKFLDPTLATRDCSLIEEGAPVPPEPPVGHWRPEPHVRIRSTFNENSVNFNSPIV